MPSDRDDVAEYWLLRRAFRDAIWDVIGTIVTVVVAGALLYLGVAMVSMGLSDFGGVTGFLWAAFGLVLVVGAIVQFMREFRLYPFDRTGER